MSKSKHNHKLNPWKTKSTKVVYKNPWITVKENKVIRPDGKDGIYGVVQIPDGVAIVALDDDDNVLLIGEWRYPISKYSWSIICGTCDNDEKPLSAAKRELAEEANIKALKWKYLLTYHPSPGLVDETAHVYLATGLKRMVGQQEETEDIKVKRVSFKKALEMVAKGKITDSYAVVGLLKAKEMLEK